MFPPEGPLRASREEDLPGYTQPRRPASFSVTRLLAIFLLALLLTPAEGCLPSWFREQRSSQPAALEGSGAVLPEESPGAALRPQRVQVAGTPYRPAAPSVDEEEEGEYESEEEEEREESHLGRYGTAKPIAVDREMEEARKAFAEIECPGYCFEGGTCVVEVEPVNYRYIGKQCKCPPNFWGNRCDIHYIKTLYSPVKGQGLHVERSAVPALAFFLIMVVVTVGLAIYSYRKITRRNEPWPTSPSLDLSQQYHLRRTRGIYARGERTPFSPRLQPRYTPKSGPLLLQGGELALPYSTVSPPLPVQTKTEADGRDNSAQMGVSYHDQRIHNSRENSSLSADSVRLPSPSRHLSPHRTEPP